MRFSAPTGTTGGHHGRLGDTVRFDPSRVRIPVLPIEDQRTHGAAFRRLADLDELFLTDHSSRKA
jgi:hypothetical protein